MHDAFNLSWKLNLAIRGLSTPALLSTYQHERRKIAQDLIAFDFEHAAAFTDGDAGALAENFATNVGFISGAGVRYAPNVLNVPWAGEKEEMEGVGGRGLRAGELLLPARVTRYIDANPVDIQLDIPMLGQFRVYFFVSDIHSSKSFLASLCAHVSSASSILGRATLAASKSYATQDLPSVEADEFLQPARYTAASRLFTFATVLTSRGMPLKKETVEIVDLPPLLALSRWTFYLDDLHDVKTGMGCADKWLGTRGVGDGEVAIVNVRPDGYVGSIGRFDTSGGDSGEACMWLDSYYGGFLKG